MTQRKNDLIQFFEWMRNGIAFVTTWFLILLLVYSAITGIKVIQTVTLIKMLVWIIGAVFIFNLFFTKILFKKWSFLKRLSTFMILISIYELVGFYWFNFFTGKENLFQWLIFIFIVLFLYAVSIFIYQRISKKQGEIYTDALKHYQQKRLMER